MIKELPKHKVKMAWESPHKKGKLYVVECICGWSSRLMQTESDANRVYSEHKNSDAS
jgi:hypothetical protein